jgi:regulator of protease activity HflC (stomatin/prohibitin superfamily)
MEVLGLVVLSGVILFTFLLAFFMGFNTVPQGYNYTVERLGRYTKTLEPGPRFIFPFAEEISHKVDMREQIIDLPTQEVITMDNAAVEVNGVVFYQVIDASAASYQVSDYKEAALSLITTNVRGAMGAMELDELLSKREEITESILNDVDNATQPWGVKILRVKIKDINPPESLAKAMTLQLTAEREKRASIFKAEGERESQILAAQGEQQSVILNAEADKEASILRAQGEGEAVLIQAQKEREAASYNAETRERLAEAEAKATYSLSQALKKGDIQVLNYFIAEKYVKSLGELACADNQKVIMLPIEATQILGALQGVGEIAKDAFSNKITAASNNDSNQGES